MAGLPTATATADLARYRANRQAEVDSAALYRVLAAAEAQSPLAQIYGQLAAEEEMHAQFWEARLRAAGAMVPVARPGIRTRLLGALARRFGPQLVLPAITRGEQHDSGRYGTQADARWALLPEDERRHAQLLAAVAAGRDGLAGSQVAQLEGRHRTIGGNALRAAVLGANDGLVSNLSLVMGVAGAQLANEAILITGLAGLLAGASSMALGEWLSVQSSRELYSRQIAREAQELAANPAAEERELALIYQAKGLPAPQARQVAAQLMQDTQGALDTLTREELGVDPRELGGSAWEAAITSFLLFAVGAIVPVLPYFFLAGPAAVAGSVALSVVGLFAIGAGITLLTGRNVLFSGTRQVLFGMGAAALTYAIGRLIGVTLAG